jgi:hypothetical protein
MQYLLNKMNEIQISSSGNEANFDKSIASSENKG